MWVSRKQLSVIYWIYYYIHLNKGVECVSLFFCNWLIDRQVLWCSNYGNVCVYICTLFLGLIEYTRNTLKRANHEIVQSDASVSSLLMWLLIFHSFYVFPPIQNKRNKKTVFSSSFPEKKKLWKEKRFWRKIKKTRTNIKPEYF